MNISDFDHRVRLAAFTFLADQIQRHGDVLPRNILEKGFVFEGERVPLMSPQGIFTPRILEIPLTFCTVPPTMRKQRPYDDELGQDGRILYRYRGTDPQHRDNLGLRRAMREQIPLIYLLGTIPGRYRPVWPVFVTGDEPASLTFSMMVDDLSYMNVAGPVVREADLELRRRYVTREVQFRLHQSVFRDRVMAAYRCRCAICRLQHEELLEAAHILPDKHPQSAPTIPNGLALCKLHHATFDLNIVGIRPDYVIEVREDILKEHDGPMLKHGIQELQGRELTTPRVREFKPNPQFLEIRYETFRKAG